MRTTSSRRRLRWLNLLTILALLALSLPATARPALAAGSVSLSTLGLPYTQDFNSLATSGTANTGLPEGWYLHESGTSARNNGAYAASTGSDTAGDVYSFGAGGIAERAFGTLFSSTLTPIIGASFTNDTGQSITSLAISYTGEQWRAGVAGRGAADRLDFQLSTDATSLTTGIWTHYDDLDFHSPNISTTVGLKDGNAAENRATVSFTITGLNIPAGAAFWIRWTDFDIAPGADDGLGIDDFSLTPARDPDTAPFVASTFPADGAADFPVGANLSVTFSEAVAVTDPWFELSCSLSGPVAVSASGGPTTFTLDPAADLQHGDACTLTIHAAQVSDQDNDDPPDTMEVDFTAGFTAFNVCAAAYTPIYAIQGSGLAAALTGTVTTQGVVVGDFEGSAGLQGFYLQDLNGDGDAATSDGIFVFTGSADVVSAGDVVRVTGFARERFNQTALNGSNSNTAPVTDIVACGAGSVQPVDVEMPFPDATYLERYEGMLVRLPQALVISEYFNYERFGEMVLALPLEGEERPFTGTAIDAPGADANARALANSLRRITLDDGLGIQNPAIVRHPNGDPFALDNRFRGGDRVQNVVGVLGFDFSLYRIQPTGRADYLPVNARPEAPEPVGGNVRVAAMNTLNYFLTPNYPSGSPLDNKCGPLQNVECRGHDFDQPDELARQRVKLLAALAGLEADVIGLNEIENTPGVDPLADIVAGLNDLLGPGTYAYIDTGVIGTDAIRVGLIYRPAHVTPVGAYAVLDSSVDPRFIDTKSRPVLAQTFEYNLNGERFTVAVNHLKSKGSACDDVGDPDAGDGQGNCNGTRTLAAQALVDWLAADPTGSGDPDFLIIGDLNSYAREDPIAAILAGPDDTPGTADDYTNLILRYQGVYAYSYVFDGQFGYLDHALASASLVAQVTGAADWHINADEPDLLDYDTTFKPPAQDALFEPNAYRSSDHDPLVVGLCLPPSLSVSVTPNLLWPANHQYRTVEAAWLASGDVTLVTLLAVTSNEPDNGEDDGNTLNDIVIVDEDTFLLRAERSGSGTGRVYTITYQAVNGCGATVTASATVTVPLNRAQ